MARKSGWQQFADNFNDVYGTFTKLGRDIETSRIMKDDQQFYDEEDKDKTTPLTGIDRDRARMRALADVYTKYGDVEGGLKIRSDLAATEKAERDTEIQRQTKQALIDQIGLQNRLIGAQATQAAGAGALSFGRARTEDATRGLKVDKLGQEVLGLNLGNKYTEATQPSAIASAIAGNQADAAESKNRQTVAEDPYSWMALTTANKAAVATNQNIQDLAPLQYIAESEELSALAKEYLSRGASADRESIKIGALEQYRKDIQEGKFVTTDGTFDEKAATNAFLQLTAAFEGAPAATALYNQYVKDGNEAVLGEIVSQGVELGAKVKNALSGPDGIYGVQALFDEENGPDFGMRIGEVQLEDGTIGIGLIETDKNGNDFRAITAAKDAVELAARLQTMTGPTGMIGLAERLYQEKTREIELRQTTASADLTEEQVITQQDLNDTSKVTAILKQGNLEAQTELARVQAEQITEKIKSEGGITYSVKQAQQAFNDFVTSQAYADLADNSDAKDLSIYTNRVRQQLKLIPSTPSGITDEEWLVMTDSERAAFGN